VPPPAHEPFEDDEIEQAFPGRVLTHLLTVSSHDQLSIAIEALQAILDAGGGLEALHLIRRGDRLDYQLRVVGLRPRQARLLADRLVALQGVVSARVEHQLLRP